MVHLGLYTHGAPVSPSGLELTTAGDTWPTWDCAPAVHLGALVAWTWEVQETWLTWDYSLMKCPDVWAAWTWEVHTTLGCGNPHVVPPLWVLPTHASGVCLQSPSPSTAQLRKQAWIRGQAPFSPLVRAEIRHWRDLQAEEANLNKEKKGELTQKWQVQQIKILQLSWDYAFEGQL